MIYLRLLMLSDAEQLAAYYQRNQDFHRQWSPLSPLDANTIEFQQKRLQIYLERHEHGEEYRFGIFSHEFLHETVQESAQENRSQLIGSINLVAVERGPFQNGRLGYSVDEQYKNQGIISTYLEQVITFAFSELGLHRLEANILPYNAASRRVLEKCKFQKIGYSPKYLNIQGIWQDHELYMRLAEDQ